MIKSGILGIILSIIVTATGFAGQVTIEKATAHRNSNGKWRIAVTLRHNDTGWDHYANEWRVLDQDNQVLGTRTLAHPHIDEQPFTRSLSGITIPEGTTSIWIEARDSVHGRNDKRYKLNLP